VFFTEAPRVFTRRWRGPRGRATPAFEEHLANCLRTCGLGTFSSRLDRLLALDHAFVGDKGRTVALLHEGRRPRAVVLLHGLTASPTQFGRFADDLFAHGHNVLVPRLPRHGHADRFSEAAARITAEELVTAAREVLAVGRELGDLVTVAGFSLGGLLAAWIAQHEVADRVVAIAPFFGVALLPSRVCCACRTRSSGGIPSSATVKCPRTAIRATRRMPSRTRIGLRASC